MSITYSGEATAGLTRWIIWSCCIPTVIGKFTVRDRWWKRPRPARGVREGSSCMRRKAPVQFLGEGAAATPLSYPTEEWWRDGHTDPQSRNRGRRRRAGQPLLQPHTSQYAVHGGGSA